MRSDYLNENSGSTFGLKKKVERITAARTLTNDDSGKVFMLDSAGGAYEITLPTASSGEAGVYYKFIVEEETPTGAITLAAGSAIVSFVMKDAGGDASNSTAGTTTLKGGSIVVLVERKRQNLYTLLSLLCVKTILGLLQYVKIK